jgi:uncharacterized membrane protein
MYTILQLAYLIVLFLVAAFSILSCIKTGKQQQDFLCIYLGISFCLEFLMFIIQIYFHSSSGFGFLYNLYILFCTLFFLHYFNQRQNVKLVRLNKLIFSVFAVVYMIFIFKNYKEVNQIIGISFSLIYILYSLIWFYGKLTYPDPDLKNMMNDAKFWVSTALLFWSVFFILRIIPRYFFSKIDVELLITSQSFFFFINIVFYTMFFIAVIKYNKNRK